jgi:zinc/manganese transport system permease protein
VDTVRLGWLVGVSIIVLAGMAVIWRPLMFISVDPEVAAARGVPAGVLSVAFTLLLGLAVSLAVQVVGALLVLSLLVTPAAAAFRVTASPVLAPLLSTLFAVVSAVGGILLALGGSIPISPFVTTISFAIYLGCRVVSARRRRTGWGTRGTEAVPPATPSPASVR